MARPWLKVEPALVDHPKTRQLARLWSCHPYSVVGFLVALWGYCLEYQEDGNVGALPPDVLDESAAPCLANAMTERFTVREALQQVGFVDEDGRLHDWDVYTGELIEQRRKDRERKRMARAKAKKGVSLTGRGQSKDGRRMSDIRVEQSRVESTLFTPPSNGQYAEEFDSTWRIYPPRAGNNPKRKAIKAWSARRKAGASANEIHAGVERYRRYCEATGRLGTEFVMHAATFFGPDEHFRELWSVPSAASAGGLRDAYLKPAEVGL